MEFLYTSKKISPPIQRQAKQELEIKVAQNWFEGTLYQSASHHNFFSFFIKTPMGEERFKEMESLFVGQKKVISLPFTPRPNKSSKKKLLRIGY